MAQTFVLNLTSDEIAILIEALDAYEYWQLGDTLPRDNGEVFIPGDLPPEEDRYWGPDPDAGDAEAEAIEQVRACRGLAERLRPAVDGATQPEYSVVDNA